MMAKSLGKHLGLKVDFQQALFACCVLSAVGTLTKLCIDTSDAISNHTLSAYLLALWGFELRLVHAQLIDQIISSDDELVLFHAVVEQLSTRESFSLTYELESALSQAGHQAGITDWYTKQWIDKGE
jgi:hypothetical protein